MEQTFRVGDLAVYPAHGVAQIIGVETREISSTKQTFYILKILDNGMKIMIPTKNAGEVGPRELIREDEVDEVFEILKSREVSVEGQTWNRRYREYMEKIKTGSVFGIAEVLADLQRLKSDKELSFGERKMLDTARTLLVKEIAVATKSKEVKIEERLDRIFTCSGEAQNPPPVRNSIQRLPKLLPPLTQSSVEARQKELLMAVRASRS